MQDDFSELLEAALYKGIASQGFWHSHSGRYRKSPLKGLTSRKKCATRIVSEN